MTRKMPIYAYYRCTLFCANIFNSRLLADAETEYVCRKAECPYTEKLVVYLNSNLIDHPVVTVAKSEKRMGCDSSSLGPLGTVGRKR
jgi:hypothetical protein